MSYISLETRSSSDSGVKITTPNCVACSRSLEHNTCSVLHLLDRNWVTEQGPHTDATENQDQI
jgi:hypothetical protein